MKLILDIPEEFYTACKKWVVDKCASIEQTIIADGIPVSTNGDLISREDLRKTFHKRIWYFDKSSWDEANALIDSAPAVDTTCPHCDSGYAQGVSDGYLRAKEDVIHSIAKQYSEHNELVPIWLSIGDIKGGVE